jgi:hypothetical protein
MPDEPTFVKLLKSPLTWLGMVASAFLTFLFAKREWTDVPPLSTPDTAPQSKSTKRNKPPRETDGKTKTPAEVKAATNKPILTREAASLYGDPYTAALKLSDGVDRLNPLIEMRPELLQDKETMSRVLSLLVSEKNTSVFKNLLTNHPTLIDHKACIGWAKHAAWGRPDDGYDIRLVPLIELINVSEATEIKELLNVLHKQGKVKLGPIPPTVTKPQRPPWGSESQIDIVPIDPLERYLNRHKGAALDQQQSSDSKLIAAREQFDREKAMAFKSSFQSSAIIRATAHSTKKSI